MPVLRCLKRVIILTLRRYNPEGVLIVRTTTEYRNQLEQLLDNWARQFQLAVAGLEIKVGELGSLGMEVQRGPGAEPWWGSEGKAPRS